MVAAGVAGTAADFVYAYVSACKEHVEVFQNQRR